MATNHISTYQGIPNCRQITWASVVVILFKQIPFQVPDLYISTNPSSGEVWLVKRTYSPDKRDECLYYWVMTVETEISKFSTFSEFLVRFEISKEATVIMGPQET